MPPRQNAPEPTPISPIDAAIDSVTPDQATLDQSTIDAFFQTTRPRLIEPVEIELDKTRHMRLPFWALRRFEKETGVGAWDHEQVWSYPPNLDLMIALIWAALLEEEPTLTLDQVEMLPGMEFANMLYLRGRLDALWGRNNPDPEPALPGGKVVVDAVPNAPAASTG